jgi:hypothetical protein
MARLYCHYCTRFYWAPVISASIGCPRCRRSLEAFEPHHVLRGRVCPGGCGAALVVTFEPAAGTPGVPLCPVCRTPWTSIPTLVRDGVTYQPVIRRDRGAFPDD